MKLSHQKMNDQNVREERLGELRYSDRNKGCDLLEERLRELSPFPTTFDVHGGQGLDFHEFAYTEFSRGLWAFTQSVEINARLMAEIATIPSTDSLDPWIEGVVDKYVLEPTPTKWSKVRKIIFLPGHNLLDVASTDQIARIIHEDDEVMVKPHPLTQPDTIAMIGRNLGYQRIIPAEVEGISLLKQVDVVYTTSTSEIAISATLLGKKVVNVSNFFLEGNGVYHPLSRLLFTAHRDNGVDAAQTILRNVLGSREQGFVMPWHDDIDERLEGYYARALALRQQYKPIAAPQRMSYPSNKEDHE